MRTSAVQLSTPAAFSASRTPVEPLEPFAGSRHALRKGLRDGACRHAAAWGAHRCHAGHRRLCTLAAHSTDGTYLEDWPAAQALLAAATTGDAARLARVLSLRPDLVATRTRVPHAEAVLGAPIPSGYCALHFSAASGQPAAVRALLAAGADPASKDDRGGTPLHWAASVVGFLSLQAGGAPCLAALLAAGADVDARDEDGETPLHCAARLGNLAAIRCLAAHGAGLAAASGEGLTPRALAILAGRAEAAQLLLELQAAREGLPPPSADWFI